MRTALILISTALVIATAGPGGPAARTASRESRPMNQGIYQFTMKTIDGADRPLAEFRGRTLLVVNTASKCGFTPQYQSLESLYRAYHDRGFEILAFPANDFMRQEPGTNAEIKTFCTTKYSTTFPLFAKISVRGRDMAPLYRWLTKDSPYPGDIRWNFTKFLIAPDGRVVARFEPPTDPLDREVRGKIEAALASAVSASGHAP